MEFQGRIAKLLPIRQGVSQRTGNEWKSLPFIFEYFEHDSDRYADSVLLETFDTKVIDNLADSGTRRESSRNRTARQPSLMTCASTRSRACARRKIR